VLECVSSEQRRAPLDLVDRGQLACRLSDLVDLPDRVVAHADLARETSRLQLEQPLPDIGPGASGRRPVDQPEIDVREPERFEALLECRLLATGAARGQLGRHEDLVARDAALGHRLPDLSLVAVCGGRVDVPIADLECPKDRVAGVTTA
jgi:hypothetical protein